MATHQMVKVGENSFACGQCGIPYPPDDPTKACVPLAPDYPYLDISDRTDERHEPDFEATAAFPHWKFRELINFTPGLHKTPETRKWELWLKWLILESGLIDVNLTWKANETANPEKLVLATTKIWYQLGHSKDKILNLLYNKHANLRKKQPGGCHYRKLSRGHAKKRNHTRPDQDEEPTMAYNPSVVSPTPVRRLSDLNGRIATTPPARNQPALSRQDTPRPAGTPHEAPKSPKKAVAVKSPKKAVAVKSPKKGAKSPKKAAGPRKLTKRLRVWVIDEDPDEFVKIYEARLVERTKLKTQAEDEWWMLEFFTRKMYDYPSSSIFTTLAEAEAEHERAIEERWNDRPKSASKPAKKRHVATGGKRSSGSKGQDQASTEEVKDAAPDDEDAEAVSKKKPRVAAVVKGPSTWKRQDTQLTSTKQVEDDDSEAEGAEAVRNWQTTKIAEAAQDRSDDDDFYEGLSC